MTITIQPLEGLTDSQTLEIMEMWVNDHKMNASRKYNEYSNVECGWIDRATLTAYEKLHEYFSNI